MAQTPDLERAPVIFCDGIHSQSFAAGATKLILTRYDQLPGTAANEVVVAQIVMPTDYFVMSVAFLEHRIKEMVRTGAIDQTDFDKARQYWIDNPAAGLVKRAE